jgi:hypothetical protein
MFDKKIRNLDKDKQINQCEKLLLKGTSSTAELARKLNVSYNTAQNYRLVVQQRWLDGTKQEDIESLRQRLIKQVEVVIHQSWIKEKQSQNIIESSTCLRTILQGLERIEKLSGINSLPPPKVETETTKSETVMMEYVQEYQILEPQEKEVVMSKIKQRLSEFKNEKPPLP